MLAVPGPVQLRTYMSSRHARCMADPDAVPAEAQVQLRTRFGAVRTIEVPYEHSPWSATWRVEFASGKTSYLKRIPRSRPEVTITALLHDLAPDVVPEVLAADLMADSEMRWFVVSDAGDCDHDELDPTLAEPAAEALAQLQRLTTGSAPVASVLPNCAAGRLAAVAAEEYRWAATGAWPTMERERLDDAWERITKRRHAFDWLAATLAYLPDTVAHADFWSRHISRPPVRFIDWADAVWGPGGIAVLRLLASEFGRLDSRSAEIWKAFARGWGVEAIPDDYIAGCDVAGTVVALVVDHNVTASWGQGPTRLKGLVNNFEALADELERVG